MDQYPNYNCEFYQEEPILLPPPPPPPRVRLSRVRWHLCIIAFAVVMVVVASSVVQVVVHNTVYDYFPAVLENEWYSWVISTVPMYLVGMPVAYLLLLTVPKSAPQKRRLSLVTWVGFLCLCFALSYAASFAGQYISNWIAFWLGVEVENELQEITSVTPLGINILFVGILAPIFEELFYRKAVIDRLRRYGELPAILISGVIFGLIHGNLSQMFYATAVGILLGFIYVRTGNVLYTMSIHAAFNMIGGVYTTELIRRLGEDLIPAAGDTVGEWMLTAYVIFCILSLIVGVIFFLANFKRSLRSLWQGEYPIPRDGWANVLIANPGTWVFALMVAFFVIANLFA